MTADVFVVTQAGLDAAVSAANGGIYLQLTTFQVGTGVNYTPTLSDTALHGTSLYTDNISSFSTALDGSLIVNCTINVNAGPFDFGEVGIYTSTGALFALMALPQLEHKYSALGTTVASTFTFSCYLRLGQAGGVIQIVTGAGGGGAGTSNFVYTMQSGQPPAVWGSADGGADSLVWNPSNFNVNSAQNIVNAGGATYAGTTHTFYAADGATHLADINSSGTLTCTNLAIPSDVRLKKNMEDIDDDEALSIVLQAQGITYQLKNTRDETRYPGVRAQDFQKLMPVAVFESDRFIEKYGSSEHELGVLYAQAALALLPGAVRGLEKKFEAQLIVKTQELKDEISSLRQLLNDRGLK